MRTYPLLLGSILEREGCGQILKAGIGPLVYIVLIRTFFLTSQSSESLKIDFCEVCCICFAALGILNKRITRPIHWPSVLENSHALLKGKGCESHLPVSRTSSTIHEIATPTRCTKSFIFVSNTALPWESKLIELIPDNLASLEWCPIILLTPWSQIKVWPRDHCGKISPQDFCINLHWLQPPSSRYLELPIFHGLVRSVHNCFSILNSWSLKCSILL